MRTDLFVDVQKRQLVEGRSSSGAASLAPLYRGDTVALAIFPLQSTGNEWSPFTLADGAEYSVTVQISTEAGVPLVVESDWTWGSDSPDTPADRWAGDVALISAAINEALVGASLSCVLEIEIGKVVDGVTRYSTLAQERVTLKRDNITH